MTGKERIANILRHEPVDRIGLFEHFWSDTRKSWIAQGKLDPAATMEDAFGLDMQEHWTFNLTTRLDFQPEVVAENEDTITLFDGNYATLKRHKKHDTTPEHVDFKVRERGAWEALIKPCLTADPARIDFVGYRKAKAEAERSGRYFVWSGTNVFEMMHPVCGHEYMLMGMAEDPDWVREMAGVYARLTIALQEILFEKEGKPDGIWYYEDMGYKGSPFMSPAMYREILKPAHRETIAFAHSLGLPVIMHSCGYVEPLLADMIDAGIDCLQVIEVKAGMDLLRLHRRFGDRIAFMGGIDVRTLYSNDRQIIDAELLAKIPQVMKGYNYVLHSDHSIPKTVGCETFQYYIQKALMLGTY